MSPLEGEGTARQMKRANGIRNIGCLEAPERSPPGQPLGGFLFESKAVARGTAKTRFTIIRKFAPEPMDEQERQAVESILAKLVARAYAADHSELFRPSLVKQEQIVISGPSAAGAPVVGALPTNAGGPERESRERDKTTCIAE